MQELAEMQASICQILDPTSPCSLLSFVVVVLVVGCCHTLYSACFVYVCMYVCKYIYNVWFLYMYICICIYIYLLQAAAAAADVEEPKDVPPSAVLTAEAAPAEADDFNSLQS